NLLQDKLLEKMAIDALKSNIKYCEGNKIPLENNLHKKYGLQHMPHIDFVLKK
ncbi:hypothetical protein M153_62600003, partial [Pseudoloma neurophilia]